MKDLLRFVKNKIAIILFLTFGLIFLGGTATATRQDEEKMDEINSLVEISLISKATVNDSVERVNAFLKSTGLDYHYQRLNDTLKEIADRCQSIRLKQENLIIKCARLFRFSNQYLTKYFSQIKYTSELICQKLTNYNQKIKTLILKYYS